MRTVRRLALVVLRALGVMLVVPPLAYSLVRPLLGFRKGWLELVDDFAPWMYLGGPVAALMGGLSGSRRLTLAGALSCVLFVARWGRRFARPDRRGVHLANVGSRGGLTLMTFNALAWTRSGDDIVAAIRQIDPDVVTLQEIGPRPMARLVISLGDRLPYSAVHAMPASSGVATLSRFPIDDAEAFTLSPHRAHGCQRMTLHAPTGPIALLNIHTKIPWIRFSRHQLGRRRLPAAFHAERRLIEVQGLCEMIDAIDGPLLVMGDFNMTERSGDYSLIASRLTDAYRAVGRGLGQTFPSWRSSPRALPAPFPVLRLDHIWHSRHFEACWARVGPSAGSDHNAVVARIAVR